MPQATKSAAAKRSLRAQTRSPRSGRAARRPAPSRRDETPQHTRARLIEVAGQLIAEKGVDRATGKEICVRAGANAAAINYHFGSFDGLYAAVLCEAHRRLASVENLQSAISTAPDPRARLQALIRLFVGALTGPISSTWVVRVLGREIVSPSPALAVLREKEVVPKFSLVRGVVAALLGLPIDHPKVARGCISIMAPCFMLLVADRKSIKRIFRGFTADARDADAIVDHLVRFALAGLSAMSDQTHGVGAAIPGADTGE